MADLALIAASSAVIFLVVEVERRRLEAEEIDRRLRVALAALSGPDVVVRRVFEQLGEALVGAGVATSRMAAVFSAGVGRLFEAAAAIEGERIPAACHCGWVPDVGGHRHIERMLTGATPELVLIRGEDLGPLGTSRVALYREDVREQLRVVPVMDVVVAPWRLVAGEAELDRALPTWRGMHYVRPRAVSA